MIQIVRAKNNRGACLVAPIVTADARKQMIDLDVNVSQIIHGMHRAEITDFVEDAKKNARMMFVAELLSAGEEFFVSASVERVVPFTGTHVIINHVLVLSRRGEECALTDFGIAELIDNTEPLCVATGRQTRNRPPRTPCAAELSSSADQVPVGRRLPEPFGRADYLPTFLIDSPVVRPPSLMDCCEYHMVINENRRSNECIANISNQAIYTTPYRRCRIAAPGCLRQHQSQQRSSKYEAERASHLEHDHLGQQRLDLRNETPYAQFTPGRGRCSGTYDGLNERIVWRTVRYGNDSKHVHCRFSSKSCGREREFHGSGRRDQQHRSGGVSAANDRAKYPDVPPRAAGVARHCGGARRSGPRRPERTRRSRRAIRGGRTDRSRSSARCGRTDGPLRSSGTNRCNRPNRCSRCNRCNRCNRSNRCVGSRFSRCGLYHPRQRRQRGRRIYCAEFADEPRAAQHYLQLRRRRRQRSLLVRRAGCNRRADCHH